MAENIPFLVIVRWLDGIRWFPVAPYCWKEVRTSGRKDRNDPRDLELCCFMQHHHFQPINVCPI